MTLSSSVLPTVLTIVLATTCCKRNTELTIAVGGAPHEIEYWEQLIDEFMDKTQIPFTITTVYVTHDQVEAMTLGDRIAIIKNGYLQQVGKPVDVYNAPDNLFVASFLGTPSMNLLSAKVLEKNGKLSIMIDKMVYTVSHSQERMLRHFLGKEITVGVRPEHISVTSNSTVNRQKERIRSVENLGHELILHFRIGTQELVAKVTYDRIYTEDLEVSMTLNQEKLHFFDDEGNRIKEL